MSEVRALSENVTNSQVVADVERTAPADVDVPSWIIIGSSEGVSVDHAEVTAVYIAHGCESCNGCRHVGTVDDDVNVDDRLSRETDDRRGSDVFDNCRRHVIEGCSEAGRDLLELLRPTGRVGSDFNRHRTIVGALSGCQATHMTR